MGLKEILNILLEIIINPFELIKGPKLLDYKPDLLETVYVVELFLIGICLVIIKLPRFVAFELFLNPLVYLITTEIIVGFYYIFFKLFAKKIEINYEALRKLLLPLLMIMYFWSILFSGIERWYPNTKPYFGFVLQVWFTLMVYFVSRYKMSQNILRSVLVISIPTIVNFFAFILNMIEKK